MRLVNSLFGPAILTVSMAAAGWFVPVSAQAADGFELVMVEREGCHWCAQWNAEIGPIYPKTPEGQAVPLRRVDLQQPLPAGLSLSGKVVFTPTFVLAQNGTEIARLEGYSGDTLFWWMIDKIFADHGIEVAAQEIPAAH